MEESTIKPKVLDYDDICELAPFFKGKRKLVNFLFKLLKMDKVNWLHENNYKTPGAPFTKGALKDLGITVEVENREVLDNLPEGAFITVSNHPFGALDGIILISELASRRKDFKVMVNLILNYITAMRENFIAVDPIATDDPEKRAVTMRGIREAMMHVKKGHPLGFFPAGAVAKINGKFKIDDQEWQPSIIRLIQQLKVPVIPIYFHGYNSVMSYILGWLYWPLRSVLLPSEVFRKRGATLKVSVGEPISVEELSKYKEVEELSKYLRDTTFSLKNKK
ncbi:MAG: lysophospholipid acyltransferase family protein [Muribaculaceae bacterium]|nr:lysophospholipid acyltransferase family protein [Muribaculaceae bacterium]